MGKLLGNREEDQGLSQCEVMPTQLGHWFLKSLIVPPFYCSSEIN